MDPLSLAGIGWGVTAASWLISPVVNRLVNKCFDALGMDPRFQSRKEALDKKLEDLKTTLLPQLIILTDAAQKSPHRRELEAWLQKLKSAYYEAEHLLGLVEYKRLEKEVNSVFPSSSKFSLKLNPWELKLRKNNLLKSLEKIEKIVNDEASKLVPMLNLSNNSINYTTPRQSNQSRETISTPILEVIGRDNDRDEIIKFLPEEIPESSNNAKCYSVIGIWGMGGLGKTTLAQYVCEYEKGAKYFDLVLWAHVSQTFSVKSIFERIWESLSNEACPKYNSIEGLQNKIREKLKRQRFLLVLDDAWCDEGVMEQHFQQLYAPLQDAKRGSKILVTTRIEGAAKALGTMKLIALRQLDHDEFLELFMSHALCDLMDAEKYFERILKQIGEEIASKLHKSPLAATTVAAQLRKRLDPDFWLSMLNQNLLKETMGALLLSYQNLPPPLQRCFAFCSLFPKGYVFEHDYLVDSWIAEGFVETEGNNKHVKDIGTEYIYDLISSSFLQVREWSGYTLHDLLHDLAEKVSNGECFRIEGGEVRKIPTHTRHLYVEACMFEKYVWHICKLKDLRTIIVQDSSNDLNLRDSLNKKDLNTLFKGSKKFYVVDLFSNWIDRFPESIFCLENLRYLSGSVDVKDFPKSSSRLYQLRRISLGYSAGIQIPNIGRLFFIQELNQFEVTNKTGCGLEQLEHLRDLYGELIIYGLNNVKSVEEARGAKLSEKKGLCALQFHWENDEEIYTYEYKYKYKYEYFNGYDCSYDYGYPETARSDENLFRSPPTQIKADIFNELCPPPQIKELKIIYYGGKSCPSWFPEYNKSTTHLEILELSRCPFLEALPETNNLVYLQSLTIVELPRLKRWEPLPSYLASLELCKCSSLAFVSEEELKKIMPTQNEYAEKQSAFDQELYKLLNYNAHLYQRYLDKQIKWHKICQSKEVNVELYLPTTLENLKMDSCFITDKVFQSSLKDHISLTHLELCDIIPITCIQYTQRGP